MQCSDPKLIVSAREVVSKWYSEKKEHKFSIEPKVLNTCKYAEYYFRTEKWVGVKDQVDMVLHLNQVTVPLFLPVCRSLYTNCLEENDRDGYRHGQTRR